MMREGWALLAEIGLWGWIMATIGFILHAFPAAQSFNKTAAFWWGSSLVILYTLWVVGMLQT